ncbi:MAG: hypothetical protein PVI44_11630 [Balneolaceae bacterium]|jgi:hypothetical protein
MGQQQLLLTILVTIIIGISIVVAINTMQASHKEANKSAVRQDILMVLNDAQTYYMKAKMLGGGGRSFDGISDSQILSIDLDNENGSYEVSGSGNTLTVKGTGSYDNVELTATATMTGDGMEVTWSEP